MHNTMAIGSNHPRPHMIPDTAHGSTGLSGATFEPPVLVGESVGAAINASIFALYAPGLLMYALKRPNRPGYSTPSPSESD